MEKLDKACTVRDCYSNPGLKSRLPRRDGGILLELTLGPERPVPAAREESRVLFRSVRRVFGGKVTVACPSLLPRRRL
ncbi:hypothetical protein CDAR_236711 [Caerostris darwini]|uniref:Uncharacterized protein n=1 Tax=Caerostris darwini TaxID=1538125 RepID=A0AAV4UEG2_9ARAC|nr:hypothetical protein CDAR_236711 [Caerostris darwini]